MRGFHVTTERRQEQIWHSKGGEIEKIFGWRCVSHCDFYSAMLRCARTWDAHFRGNDGTFDRTPGLTAIYDDASVDGPFQRAGRWNERQGQTRDVSFRGLYFLIDADFAPDHPSNLFSPCPARSPWPATFTSGASRKSCASSRTTDAAASRRASTATSFCPPPRSLKRAVRPRTPSVLRFYLSNSKLRARVAVVVVRPPAGQRLKPR